MKNKKIKASNNSDFNEEDYDFKTREKLKKAYEAIAIPGELTTFSSIAKEAGKPKDQTFFNNLADELTLIGISEDSIAQYQEYIRDPLNFKRKQKTRIFVFMMFLFIVNAECDEVELDTAIDDFVDFKNVFARIQSNASHLTPEERKAIQYWQFGLGHNFYDTAKLMKVRKETVSDYIKSGCQKVFGPDFNLDQLFNLRGGRNGKR